MFLAITGGIGSYLSGGPMSTLFARGQKTFHFRIKGNGLSTDINNLVIGGGGIQGDVLATDKNTVGMGDSGIKSAIQGSNVHNPDEAFPSFVSGAMAKAGKGLLEGTLQAVFFFNCDNTLEFFPLSPKSPASK